MINAINLTNQPQYRIIVQCKNDKAPVTIAGFLADEQTETVLCRHLSNLCLQSDGSFLCTQLLISKLVLQWQQSFKMNATQTLQVAADIETQNVQSVCLYKTKDSGNEELIIKVLF